VAAAHEQVAVAHLEVAAAQEPGAIMYLSVAAVHDYGIPMREIKRFFCVAAAPARGVGLYVIMWFDRIRGGLAPHKMAPSI